MSKSFIINVLKGISNYIIILIVFIILCLIIKFNFSTINNVDNYVYNFINNIQTDKLTQFMKSITLFGSAYVLIPLSILLIIVLKNKIEALLISLNLLFVFCSNNLIKHIFNRERPISEFVSYASSSFPSSHTMCSTAFYGFLVILINSKIKNKLIKFILLLLCIILVLLIGFSRMYLEAHYLTDVIGGLILGLIMLGMFVSILKYINKEC